MSSKRERDDDSEEEKPAKKAKVDESGSDEEGNATEWPLGKQKKITLGSFKGMTLIDIREYYTDAAGLQKPGKKGISLTLEQYQALKEALPKVDKAIASKK